MGSAPQYAVGVVHRDLKLDNVFVTPTTDGAELVKLLDFGVATSSSIATTKTSDFRRKPVR